MKMQSKPPGRAGARWKQTIAVAAAWVVFSGLASAWADFVIDPTNATSSSHLNGNTLIGETIDGSGLSSGLGSLPTGSAIPNPWPSHDNGDPFVGTNGWISANGDTNAVLTFNLGAVYVLSGLHIWNLNESLGETHPEFLQRGIQTADVQVSSFADFHTFTDLGTFSFDEASGLSTYNGEDRAMTARGEFVRFNVTSNWGDPSYTGLSEIRFIGDIPEPGSMALLGIGAAALWLRLRRR